MGSKKKLILAISSFSLVFVSVIVAVVAIFAAQRQGVQTTFRISYTAKNVAATVQANYTVGATTTAMHTDAGEEELVFLPEMAEGTGKLSPESDNIDMGEESVVYLEYIFKNDSDTVDVAISLNTSAFELNNMRVSYAYSYSRVTEYATMPTDDSFEPMMILGKTDEDGEYATLYVYMKVEVDNLANDASFTGNIVYNLDREDKIVKLSFENTSSLSNAVLFQSRYVPGNSVLYYEDLPVPEATNGKTYQLFDDAGIIPRYTYFGGSVAEKTFHVAESSFSYSWYEGTSDDFITITNESSEPIYLEGDEEFWFGRGDKRDGSKVIGFDGRYVKLDANQTVSARESFGENAPIGIYEVKPTDIDTRLFYAAYGEYPQTYVGDYLNEILKSTSLTPTGKTYFVDGEELVEYKYNGKKYVKLQHAFYVYWLNDPIFSTGDRVVMDETYFFEVEPIMFEAMQKNANGTYTMMCMYALGSICFSGSKDYYTGIWKDSDIREYLNNDFLIESGIGSVVVETTIKNNVPGNYVDGSGEDTTDKIWLASAEELLTWTGVTDWVDNLTDEQIVRENGAQRIRRSTDLAIATHTSAMNDGSDGADYYLRSAGVHEYDDVYSCTVGTSGCVYPYSDYADSYYGFCPVFAVNL